MLHCPLSKDTTVLQDAKVVDVVGHVSRTVTVTVKGCSTSGMKLASKGDKLLAVVELTGVKSRRG
jgi:hypothetical protein